MHIRTTLRIVLLSLVALMPQAGASGQTQPNATAPAPSAPGGDPDWRNTIAEVLGKPGTDMPGEVYRVALPRTDLQVTLDGVRLLPGFALGSWVAFHEHGGQVMLMGDLVLLESEIAPVMRRLAEGGVEVTALHNHLVRAQPATMYLHVAGLGEPRRIAVVLRTAVQESATPLEGAASPSAEDRMEGLDTAAFTQALGREGRVAGAVYSVSVPRAEAVQENGAEVPPAMGLGTVINLQAAGNGRAAVTGDFVLTAPEVVPVQRALVESGIEVTAIHNHMLHEQPRLFFMHFWGVGEPEGLARGLRTALDRTNSRRTDAAPGRDGGRR
ncbi:DUF1259 domain-containing protein [Sabulicella rubraurantiaca]|uniref:DUF1259 domain-containing protein n=1 Tax=Sabulicella rubraurantiaca TaxID=2811429 RepID=UPI001F481E12|nr:DUF1259 domain-containing protein [Sabulicella rubraurantiaca]